MYRFLVLKRSLEGILILDVKHHHTGECCLLPAGMDEFDCAVLNRHHVLSLYGNSYSGNLYQVPFMRPLEEYENRITVWRATQGFTYRSVEDDLIGSWIRLKRFFAIMEGFHTGTLDLSGRHLDRYKYVHARIQQFLKDVIDALQTSVCQVMVPPHYRGVLYLCAPPHPLWN
ncbi:hypothetical protein ABKN59_006687 [Abortiporus biennis]